MAYEPASYDALVRAFRLQFECWFGITPEQALEIDQDLEDMAQAESTSQETEEV